MLNEAEARNDKKEAIVIKKYANRRLYNTETSTYVTLEDLAAMVRNDKDFVVYDAKSGDELTHAVLTQIIVEQEGRHGGQTLLPVPFLRQLIRFYDDSIGRMVPSYLQFSLENLVKEQEKLRGHISKAFSNPTAAPAAAFEVYQDMARQNMAMFEQAMQMWSSFGTSGSKDAGDATSGATVDTTAQTTAKPTSAAVASSKASSKDESELKDLKDQLAEMQRKIDAINKKS